MPRTPMRAAAVGALLALFSAGCAAPLTTRERTTLGGAALGAGTGALIGSATHHSPGAGAAIGGAIGALGGALLGDEVQAQERERYDDEDYRYRRHHPYDDDGYYDGY